ncbi:MAG: hypothetical protein WCI38_08600 [Chthoniobacterales bacterium]|jgi:hypothetical protein
MRPFLGGLAALLAIVCSVEAQLPWQLLNFLPPAGRIPPSLVTECSGLVQSLRYPGVYWALGDSGSSASVAPVLADGRLAPGWSGRVKIEGTKNYDWEDIALDGKGNLIIADVGNNLGQRGQIMLHFVPEPKPGSIAIRPTRTLQVYYEDQKEITSDYDCEAVFYIDDRIFFLTKHHNNRFTMLYRLDGESTRRSNPLRRVGSFDIGGMVTAADASPDGKLVAVLTYTAVWIFDYDARAGTIFGRSARRLPIFAWQAEALAFDGNNSLVLANESGQMFRVAVSDFQIVK